MRALGRLFASFLLAGMVGCQPPLPALVPTPPPTLPGVVRIFGGTLSPLPGDKLSLVHISPEAAAKVVIDHELETGWPDPEIAWKDGRCALVAWYERDSRTRMPVPPEPSAVYLVRLVDQQDASRVTWVMVEATTGEIGAVFGGPATRDVCPGGTMSDGRSRGISDAD